MKRFLLSILFASFCFTSLFGQSEGDFRSRLDGNWGDSNTWEEFVSGAWVNTANVPDGTENQIELVSDISVTIIAGNTINISAGTTLLNNGTLILETSGRNNGELYVSGEMTNNQGSITSGTSASKLFFLSGGVYNHNFTTTEGTIPTASWGSSSTVNIIGYTSNGTAPNGLTQAFHDFNWNCPNMTTSFFDLGGTLSDINGDLTISSTGTGSLSMSDFASSTINIDGSFNITGNSEVYFNYQQPVTYNIGVDLILSTSGNTYFGDEAALTLNISNELVVNGSGLYDFGGFSGISTTDIFVKDFSIISGTIQATGSGVKTINFNSGLASTYVKSGGTLSGSINYSITNSTNLNLGTYPLEGSGNFEISAGSTLTTANTEGITTGTTSGAIRVSGTRTYNTGSTIEYNGSVAQALGGGFPASDVNLTINNTGGGVDLSSDVTISSGRTLTLTEGTLNIGNGNLLTLNGSVSTTNGGISGGSLSNLAIGGTGAFGILGFVGTNELGDFTIDRSSSGTVTLGGDLTVNGVLTQTNGDLLLNGNTLTISGDYDQTGGTLISNSTSSLIINGTGTLPAGLSFSGDINTITLDRSSTTLNTAASSFTATNINLYSGILDGTAISIADGGTLERRTNGSLTNPLTAVGSYNLIYDHSTAMNTGAELPTSTTAINNIEKRGTGVLAVQNDFTANGSLTFTNGSFDAGANTISLNGDLVANAGSTLSNATITFDGTTNLSGSSTPTFGNITVNGTFNPTSSLNVNGDITNNGTLNSTSGTLTINAISQLGGTNPITVNNLTIGSSGDVTASSSQALQINGDLANNGVFTANEGTIIFGGTTSISGTVPDFANVQIDGTFNSPSSLTVSGDFINDGTFVHNGGTLNLNGSGSRNIGGSSALALHALNVSGGTVNNTNTAGVTIADGITIGANTTFDVDGAGSNQLTLLSTSSSQAAYVGQIPSTSSITGNITVERYFSEGRFWRYLGSPVTNSTVADWQEEFPITGTFDDPSSGTYDGSNLNSSNPSLYYYDAAGSAYVAYPTSGTAASNPIENGRGYSPFIRNSVSNIIGAVTGTLQQQSASMPVAYNGDPNESWNLVANPYAAPIDWEAAGWTKTNVADEVHVPLTSGGYATYINGTASNGGSQYIASGQAFWVRTNGSSPALATEESVKNVAQNPTYQRTEPLELFRIEMSHSDLSDEIVLVLRDEATFGYDEEFDANRRLNINGFGYTLSTTGDDGRDLKINSIPKVVDSDCSITIPVNMESVTKTGDFTLSFSEVNTLLNYYTVDFIDNYEDEIISVDSDFQYNYEINSDAGSKAKTRFSLLLNNKGIDALNDLSSIETCTSSEVSYLLENLNQNSNYSIYKGQVKLSEVSNQTEASISIADSLIQDTVNEFDVYGRAGTCDSVKVGTFIINTVDGNINLDANVIGSNICPEATEGNFEINTESGVDYFILAGNDTIQTIIGDGTLFAGTIESTYLSVGTNAFSIYAEKNECAYGSLNQQIEIIVDDFEIDQNIAFNSTNSCLKTPTDISFVSQSGVDYKIFKGTTLVNSVTGDGMKQTVEITETNLTLGLNEFTIVAQHGECAEFEFPDTIQIEVEENINTNLSLIAENTCGDDNASIIIENAQSGKTYTLLSGSENLSSLIANADGELIFNLNSNQLSQGLNELDVQIEGENCGAVLSTNQAIINVYEPINSNLDFVSTDVCNAEEATIGISNAQAGKLYKLYKGESLVESITANTDGELIFANANDELVQGLNTFNLKIEGEGCGLVEVEQNLTVTLFESINPNLDIISPNACTGDQVNIEITNPQAGKSYRLMASEEIMATEIASSEESLVFSLPSNHFGLGYHVLTVDILDDNCGVITANQTVEFELFDTAIISDVENQNICKNESITIDLSANISMSNYQLYIGDELISEETGSTLSLSPSETTTYTLTGIPESGCGVNSVNFTVEVTDLATPGILVSNNVLESSIEADSYQWYLNGEILDGETGKIIVVQESGDYRVEVNKANCVQISDVYTFSEEVLSANKALENSIQLYPNPVVDILRINLGNINEIEVKIYTLSGRFMDKVELNSGNEQNIDMSKFSKGTYLLELTSEKGSITKRIIKK